ncbi:MAG TPA: ABC transporter permease [Gemmatimonadales bacterium]|nr:ABC transporter permease [Gemmatimonadales bacterium]
MKRSGAGAAVLALVIGLAVLAAGLWVAGFDALAALTALWRGAFGSWYAFTSATLVRAVPLVIIGLGIAVAFRANALNIGAEGQFYAGAIAATWTGLHLGHVSPGLAVPAVWLAAALAGALWVVLPVWLRVRFGVLEVISTLLLNFVAGALVSWMVQGPLQEAKRIYPQSDPIADAARLPLLPGTRLHLGFVVGVVLAIVVWYVFERTIWGFELLVTGTGPRAASVSGRINVGRVIGYALLWSGAIAGLAGGIEVAGVSYALFQNLSPGYGFTAIAVALLARLRPIAIVGAGVLFGALEAGAGAMQRDAGIPAVAVYVVEGVIILVLLLAEATARRARTTVTLPDAPAEAA